MVVIQEHFTVNCCKYTCVVKTFFGRKGGLFVFVIFRDLETRLDESWTLHFCLVLTIFYQKNNKERCTNGPQDFLFGTHENVIL